MEEISSDGESERGDYESTGFGGIAESPSYIQASRVLRSCGSYGEAAHCLQKARLSFIEAYAPKPVRQEDMRELRRA